MQAYYHNGYYLLKLEDDNDAVVDTNFKRHKEIEPLLTSIKKLYIYRRNDSTILAREPWNIHEKEL